MFHHSAGCLVKAHDGFQTTKIVNIQGIFMRISTDSFTWQKSSLYSPTTSLTAIYLAHAAILEYEKYFIRNGTFFCAICIRATTGK